MNELRVFSYNDVDVVYSRDVAEMIRRPHNDLMKSIRAYCDYLGQGDFSQSDFFIPSTYINSQNKEQPCYLLTKKGCDMVANKMTGEKGVLFTAAYVTAFEKMREHIQGSKVKRVGMTDYQQMMAETRRRNARVQAARILTQLAKQYHGTTYEQVLNAHATKELTGEYLLPLIWLQHWFRQYLNISGINPHTYVMSSGISFQHKPDIPIRSNGFYVRYPVGRNDITAS